MKESILSDKSLKFAIRIVKLAKHLKDLKSEYILSKQILKSGTSIGAMVREANFAESKPDFIHKLSIAQKESSETEYWLVLLKETDYISETEFQSLSSELIEILKIITASIKTVKSKVNK